MFSGAIRVNLIMQPGPCFQLLILRVGIINEAHRRATAVDVYMYLCTSTINWGLMRALAQMVARKCIGRWRTPTPDLGQGSYRLD